MTTYTCGKMQDVSSFLVLVVLFFGSNIKFEVLCAPGPIGNDPESSAGLPFTQTTNEKLAVPTPGIKAGNTDGKTWFC